MSLSIWAAPFDVLFVVSAVLALMGAVCALGLIRPRDFVVSHPQPTPAPAGPVDSLSGPGR
jgi:hypothetical protein